MSEIERLMTPEELLDMIKEIVRDPMVYSETMGYEAISRLGRVQELLLTEVRGEEHKGLV